MRFLARVAWLCAVGLLLPLMPACAQQFAEIVKFQASDPALPEPVLLRAELVRPEGSGPFPAVVLMHGCGGWQPAVHYALQRHAEYLAKHGYAVLDLDSFGPRHVSGGKLCASDARLRDALQYRLNDAFDALRYLEAQPFVDARNIFLMGQSNGGSVALEAASADERASNDGTIAFRAVVAYYPWCGVYSGLRAQLVSPVLIFSGGMDDWVSARECQAIHAKGADLAVDVYREAAHSFDVDTLPQRYLGHLIGYDEPAAEDSEAKMLAFFDTYRSRDGMTVAGAGVRP